MMNDFAERLSKLLAAVETMRTYQKGYFKTRSKEYLRLAFKWESTTDKLLTEWKQHGTAPMDITKQADPIHQSSFVVTRTKQLPDDNSHQSSFKI